MTSRGARVCISLEFPAFPPARDIPLSLRILRCQFGTLKNALVLTFQTGMSSSPEPGVLRRGPGLQGPAFRPQRASVS